VSIIKCPICGGQVSTKAETCPHCGTDIASQIRVCPNCGCECLVTQEFCPECESKLEELPSPIPSPEEEEEEEVEEEGIENENRLKSLLMRKQVLWGAAAVVVLVMLCTGIYFFHQYRTNQREQADYERLEGTTNPEYYQKFLNDYPDGKHYDEIKERMLNLLSEEEDWNALLKNVSQSGVKQFMQRHPNSIHLRTCEDLLDSLDWQAALAAGNEEAITNYLTNHPSGRYAGDASDKKNALLLSMVKPNELNTIRGILKSFFNNAIGMQDIDAAFDAIAQPITFNGRQDANAETIIEYARNKMEGDVISLHYEIGTDIKAHKSNLPDGDTGYSVEFTLHETVYKSDISNPTTERKYHVNTTLNYQYKIMRMIIL
jgi:hypothetical protein